MPATTIKSIIAEKIEGLAWGPDLPNGHHVLYVLSDNDLKTDFPTEIFAFEIDGTAAGITYPPQVLPGPLFPPGQVKQILSGKTSNSALRGVSADGATGLGARRVVRRDERIPPTIRTVTSSPYMEIKYRANGLPRRRARKERRLTLRFHSVKDI